MSKAKLDYNKQYYASNKGQIQIQQKQYRSTHKEQISLQQAEWRKNFPEKVANYRAANAPKLREQARQSRMKHRDEWNQRRKQIAEDLRQKFLMQFGQAKEGHVCGVCPCCGEDLYHFGTLHHINGDGKEHRMEKSHHAMLREAIQSQDRTRFAALCFNCNLAAERNGGHCPGHSKGGGV